MKFINRYDQGRENIMQNFIKSNSLTTTTIYLCLVCLIMFINSSSAFAQGSLTKFEIVQKISELEQDFKNTPDSKKAYQLSLLYSNTKIENYDKAQYWINIAEKLHTNAKRNNQDIVESNSNSETTEENATVGYDVVDVVEKPNKQTKVFKNSGSTKTVSNDENKTIKFINGKYKIKRGDTLYQIALAAQNYYPDKMVDEIANIIYQTNPRSFQGTINKLEIGREITLNINKIFKKVYIVADKKGTKSASLAKSVFNRKTGGKPISALGKGIINIADNRAPQFAQDDQSVNQIAKIKSTDKTFSTKRDTILGSNASTIKKDKTAKIQTTNNNDVKKIKTSWVDPSKLNSTESTGVAKYIERINNLENEKLVLSAQLSAKQKEVSKYNELKVYSDNLLRDKNKLQKALDSQQQKFNKINVKNGKGDNVIKQKDEQINTLTKEVESLQNKINESQEMLLSLNKIIESEIKNKKVRQTASQ